MMCVTVSQAVCDSSIIFRHDGVKYFENFAIVGINKHLSIMKHTFVTTEPCRSRKLSLSEQTVIINDERSVLADWVSNPQFAGLNMAGLKRNHCTTEQNRFLFHFQYYTNIDWLAEHPNWTIAWGTIMDLRILFLVFVLSWPGDVKNKTKLWCDQEAPTFCYKLAEVCFW